MQRRHLAALAAAIAIPVAYALGAGPAGGTIGPGRQILLSVDFAPRDIVKVEVGDFHFRPGQKAPVHTHAAPAIGYVSKGTIYYQVEGMPAQILKTGDAFYEPVGPRILHFDNASETEEAVFTDFNLQQSGEPFIVFAKPLTEKIDRRTLPTAQFSAKDVTRAVSYRESVSRGAPLERRPAHPLLGYVAGGEITVTVDGAAPQTVATGKSFHAAAGTVVSIAASGADATIVTFSLER